MIKDFLTEKQFARSDHITACAKNLTVYSVAVEIFLSILYNNIDPANIFLPLKS